MPRFRFGDRLMVGQQVLALLIGVQIPVPEHLYKNEQKCPFLLCLISSKITSHFFIFSKCSDFIDLKKFESLCLFFI